jgi:two-component system OmpR family response regulator
MTRLLLIDDDELQLELVERALSRDGFEVRGAGSIAEILIVAKDFTPELVLVDVNLGDIPTERVIAAVRQAAPTARVVLYSAWEDSKLRKLATTIGVDGYISKSESVMALAAKLRSVAG